jgi:hypothetical protein
MAYDPVAGSQTLECLRVFLELRKAARPQPKKAIMLGGDSQDEYGDLDFDYEDPALNDLLGVVAPAQISNSVAQDPVDVFNRTDADFAEVRFRDANTIPELMSRLGSS